MDSSASVSQSAEDSQSNEIEVIEETENNKEHVSDTQPTKENPETLQDAVNLEQRDISNTQQQQQQQQNGEPDAQRGTSDTPQKTEQAIGVGSSSPNLHTNKEDPDDSKPVMSTTDDSKEPSSSSKVFDRGEEDTQPTRVTGGSKLPGTSENPYFMLGSPSDDEEEPESSGSRMKQRTPSEDASIDQGDYKFEDRTTSPAEDGAVLQSESSSSVESDDTQEEKQRVREQLVEQYRQAVIEHKIARETNLQLQTKLAEYFRRKKADAAEQQSGTSSLGGSTADATVDYEQRYNKYILSLTELRHQYQAMQNSYHKQIEELKNVCSQRQQEVEEAYKEFTNYKYNIGKKALHSRTGRPINPKDLLAMLAAEQKKEAIVMEVRLENIKLRNEVAKVEAVLKSKEELAEGLHLIDFEQLKIENQTYNEKIEERNEELAKLKKKISSTVQIMTHVKEKLQAVQHDNAKQRQRLGIADAELTFNRDQLTRLKQARDHLRADNTRLRRSCGLLGKSALLFNYEDSVDAVNSKRAALEETKRITSQYRTRTKSLIDKIESSHDRTANR